MQDAFESWIGEEVLVQLRFGQLKLSLRGALLWEQTETLRMRSEAGVDIEIKKANILALEEVKRGGLPCRPNCMIFSKDGSIKTFI